MMKPFLKQREQMIGQQIFFLKQIWKHMDCIHKLEFV